MADFTKLLNGEGDLPDDPLFEALYTELKKIARGRSLYARHCARCHGMGTRSTGIIPDLKRSKRGIHQSWNQIVLAGILAGGGMASFADVLDEPGAEDIHAYVVSRALHEPSVLESLARWATQYACIPAEWVAD